MYRHLYSLLFYLLIPLALLRLLYRSRKAPAYARRWRERFGWIQLPADFRRGNRAIWVHAVSVGESLAAAPLIRELLTRYPGRQLVVTTMTPTGSERVTALFGEQVFHVYLPYDLPGAARRFITRIDPALLVIMETELWPNLLHACRRAGVGTLLVNARLSEKSARGYARIAPLTRAMLGDLDVIAAQSPSDAQRFNELGADPARVLVCGSLKFDVDPPAINAGELPAAFQEVASQQRPVLIAASTREGEEVRVLAAFRQCLEQRPDLLLILVPRHPERFDAVMELCQAQQFNCVRRSGTQPCEAGTQVFLGDSMGEMWRYYSVADLAFVGGSLVDTGCHNVLEPAVLGLPVLVGPSQFNFQTICQQLQEAGALITVMDEADLAQQVLQLLRNDNWRRAMGEAGRKLVNANRGALPKIMSLIEQQLSS